MCRSNALAATEIPFSSRHRPRAAAAPATLKPLRGVKPDERCPRLEIIVAARDGHVGANLALLGDRAVGRRVRVHWPNERDCFRGVVSGFDRETWLHSLEYDDGDVEPAIRLWREVVHLGVPEDERADREEATREARRGKVDAAGTGAGAPPPTPPLRSGRTSPRRATATAGSFPPHSIAGARGSEERRRLLSAGIRAAAGAVAAGAPTAGRSESDGERRNHADERHGTTTNERMNARTNERTTNDDAR